MISVKNTFDERKKEIEKYFDFLQDYDIKANKDEKLFKILKSNLLIMLYNLTESSMSNAIEEIHNNIHSNSVSFNVLKNDFKSLIIKNTKHFNPNDLVSKINDIATDVVKHTFKKDELFSGNVDASKIREIAKRYGFVSDTDYAKTKHVSHLFSIRCKRNDLAHGVYSFAEVGKEYPIEDLKEMKDTTICYISEILDNIESYLTNRAYCA